jgi:hypothetical protein
MQRNRGKVAGFFDIVFQGKQNMTIIGTTYIAVNTKKVLGKFAEN